MGPNKFIWLITLLKDGTIRPTKCAFSEENTSSYYCFPEFSDSELEEIHEQWLLGNGLCSKTHKVNNLNAVPMDLLTLSAVIEAKDEIHWELLMARTDIHVLNDIFDFVHQARHGKDKVPFFFLVAGEKSEAISPAMASPEAILATASLLYQEMDEGHIYMLSDKDYWCFKVTDREGRKDEVIGHILSNALKGLYVPASGDLGFTDNLSNVINSVLEAHGDLGIPALINLKEKLEMEKKENAAPEDLGFWMTVVYGNKAPVTRWVAGLLHRNEFKAGPVQNWRDLIDGDVKAVYYSVTPGFFSVFYLAEGSKASALFGELTRALATGRVNVGWPNDKEELYASLTKEDGTFKKISTDWLSEINTEDKTEEVEEGQVYVLTTGPVSLKHPIKIFDPEGTNVKVLVFTTKEFDELNIDVSQMPGTIAFELIDGQLHEATWARQGSGTNADERDLHQMYTILSTRIAQQEKLAGSKPVYVITVRDISNHEPIKVWHPERENIKLFRYTADEFNSLGINFLNASDSMAFEIVEGKYLITQITSTGLGQEASEYDMQRMYEMFYVKLAGNTFQSQPAQHPFGQGCTGDNVNFSPSNEIAAMEQAIFTLQQQLMSLKMKVGQPSQPHIGQPFTFPVQPWGYNQFPGLGHQPYASPFVNQPFGTVQQKTCRCIQPCQCMETNTQAKTEFRSL